MSLGTVPLTFLDRTAPVKPVITNDAWQCIKKNMEPIVTERGGGGLGWHGTVNRKLILVNTKHLKVKHATLLSIVVTRLFFFPVSLARLATLKPLKLRPCLEHVLKEVGGGRWRRKRNTIAL